MQALRLDHLVLSASDIDATERWYMEILGLESFGFGEGPRALRVGEQKINLHPLETEVGPRAATPAPGTADLCFVTETGLETVSTRLRRAGVAIEVGRARRCALFTFAARTAI